MMENAHRMENCDEYVELWCEPPTNPVCPGAWDCTDITNIWL
jgi:hypothetical protein